MMKNKVFAFSKVVAIAGLLVVAYAATAYGTYIGFTTRIPSGNDFFSRWLGARALLLEGRDPYSPEVTREIQIGMLGHLQPEGSDQVAFAYPLYVIFAFLPLVPLEYPQAQALWMAALVYLVVAGVIITLKAIGQKTSPLWLLTLILGSLFFYPTARSIINGQFAILVFFLLALGWWGILRKKDFLAGSLLALSTIKPQMIFFILPLIILWSLLQRRWGIILGFALTLLGLFSASWILLPNWLPQFLQAAGAYQSYNRYYTGGLSPIGLGINALRPGWEYWPTIILSLALASFTFFRWYRASKNGDSQLWQALGITSVATLLILAETGSHNQVLLIPPLLYWLGGWTKGGGQRSCIVVLLAALVILVPWILFLATVKGSHEHPLVALPLPALALVLFGLFWPNDRKANDGE